MKVKTGKYRHRPKLKHDTYIPQVDIPEGFTLIQDTSEQLPLFDDAIWIIDRHLKTGDYSVDGFEDLITIERKSRNDLYSSLGVDRERFTKVIERMLKMQWKGLILEGNEQLILTPGDYSDIAPNSIYHTLSSYEVKGIHVYYASNRDYGRWWVLSRLTRFYNYMREGRL